MIHDIICYFSYAAASQISTLSDDSLFQQNSSFVLLLRDFIESCGFNWICQRFYHRYSYSHTDYEETPTLLCESDVFCKEAWMLGSPHHRTTHEDTRIRKQSRWCCFLFPWNTKKLWSSCGSFLYGSYMTLMQSIFNPVIHMHHLTTADTHHQIVIRLDVKYITLDDTKFDLTGYKVP